MEYNYTHPRAEKARIAAAFGGLWRMLLVVALVGLLLAGVAFVLAGHAIGWVLAGFSAAPMMLLAWYRGELRDVPAGPGDSVMDLLSSSIMGHLPRNPSPLDIAQATLNSTGGQFMAVRFGLTGNFFGRSHVYGKCMVLLSE